MSVQYLSNENSKEKHKFSHRENCPECGGDMDPSVLASMRHVGGRDTRSC
jgi:rRNA maturation protein Nop10